MLREKKRIPAEKLADSLSTLLKNEMFHYSLFACCLEVVLYSYNSKRIFPWVLEVFGGEGTNGGGTNDGVRLQAFHFYKVELER